MPTSVYHHPTSDSRPSYIYKSEKDKYISFMSTKFSYINNVIIPFFDKYPIIGIRRKSLDFSDFKKVAFGTIVKTNKHLTPVLLRCFAVVRRL